MTSGVNRLPCSREPVSLSPAQLSMLFKGIDWALPEGTWKPRQACEQLRARVDSVHAKLRTLL